MGKNRLILLGLAAWCIPHFGNSLVVAEAAPASSEEELTSRLARLEARVKKLEEERDDATFRGADGICRPERAYPLEYAAGGGGLGWRERIARVYEGVYDAPSAVHLITSLHPLEVEEEYGELRECFVVVNSGAMPGGWLREDEDDKGAEVRSVESWVVGEVMKLFGAAEEEMRMPYWNSHGLFGSRDLKESWGGQLLEEYKNDWVDWRLGLMDGGKRVKVIGLDSGGWPPTTGLMGMCGDGMRVVLKVKRKLVDTVLWREYVGGGGKFNDIKVITKRVAKRRLMKCII